LETGSAHLANFSPSHACPACQRDVGPCPHRRSMHAKTHAISIAVAPFDRVRRHTILIAPRFPPCIVRPSLVHTCPDAPNPDRTPNAPVLSFLKVSVCSVPSLLPHSIPHLTPLDIATSSTAAPVCCRLAPTSPLLQAPPVVDLVCCCHPRASSPHRPRIKSCRCELPRSRAGTFFLGC
jgi:hypothetical protein